MFQDPPVVPLVSKLMVALTHTDAGPLMVPAVTWGLTVTFTDSDCSSATIGHRIIDGCRALSYATYNAE